MTETVKVEFLENKAGEILAGEIINGVQQTGTGALLIVNNYILGLIWGIDKKDKNGNLSSSGLAVLLKLDTLYSLKNYIKLVSYNANPLTLYFQVQFITFHCSINAKTAIKCIDLNAKKENMMIQKKKTSSSKDMWWLKRIQETV